MRASRRIFVCLPSVWCATIMSSPRKQVRKLAENSSKLCKNVRKNMLKWQKMIKNKKKFNFYGNKFACFGNFLYLCGKF